MSLASSWPEAVLLRTITARAFSEAMLPDLSRIGLPLEMLSDQFTGKLAKEVCKLLQIKQVHTTAYHLQTNREIDSMVL